jgi:hypothetical protein
MKTKQHQTNSKTNIKLYTYAGKTLSLPEWTKITGRSRQALQARLDKGLPYHLVFIYDLPKQDEAKLFKEWEQVLLCNKTDINELERLYDLEKVINFTNRLHTLNRSEWLLFHFISHTIYLPPILSEAFNPCGFNTEVYKMQNHNLAKIEEIIKTLNTNISLEHRTEIIHLAKTFRSLSTRDVLKAYFGMYI